MKLKKGERFYSGPRITGRPVQSLAAWLALFITYGPRNRMTRALGFVLLAYAGSTTMEAWPGQRTLMKALRVVPRTVIDHAWAGEAQGWWRIEVGQRGNMRRGNIYSLTAPAHLVEAAATQPAVNPAGNR
jgi:hypothetical protein